MILYFSASGNSRYIAETTAEMLSDDMVCLNDRIKKQNYQEIHSETPFILVCPIYAWRIPRIVETHLRNTILSGNDKIYLLVTTCGSSGNAGRYAEEFFASIGKTWMGWHTFHMPGSYVAFLENPDLEHAGEMNRSAREQLKSLVPLLRNGERLDCQRISSLWKFMSRTANPLFYRFIIGKPGFYATDKCIGCGKCERVCPLNNIKMAGDIPRWENTCTHCMACIHQCPAQAVEFRKISVGKNRYYNTGEL